MLAPVADLHDPIGDLLAASGQEVPVGPRGPRVRHDPEEDDIVPAALWLRLALGGEADPLLGGGVVVEEGDALHPQGEPREGAVYVADLLVPVHDALCTSARATLAPSVRIGCGSNASRASRSGSAPSTATTSPGTSIPRLLTTPSPNTRRFSKLCCVP